MSPLFKFRKQYGRICVSGHGEISYPLTQDYEYYEIQITGHSRQFSDPCNTLEGDEVKCGFTRERGDNKFTIRWKTEGSVTIDWLVWRRLFG